METRLILSYDHFKRNKISISMDRVSNRQRTIDVFDRYHPIARYIVYKVQSKYIAVDALELTFEPRSRCFFDDSFGFSRLPSFFNPMRVIIKGRKLEYEVHSFY